MIKRSDVDWELAFETLLDIRIDEATELLRLLNEQRYIDAASRLGRIQEDAENALVRFFGADEAYSLDPMKGQNND